MPKNCSQKPPHHYPASSSRHRPSSLARWALALGLAMALAGCGETNPTPKAVIPASTPIARPASTPTPVPTSTLASGASDETVRLWRVSECASHPERCGRLLHTLEGHADSVASVAFSPDGTLLASGATDGTIRLWAVTEE